MSREVLNLPSVEASNSVTHLDQSFELAPRARLQDSFGRKFSYLRLSVTDACNFKCKYCLPNGFKPNGPSNFLNLTEIENLVRTFARLGTRKIRLTGGEPTLRSDLGEIARAIKSVEGIETLALSTNGHSLFEQAAEFRANGIDQLNISVDSLDRARFHANTGRDSLPAVLAGIDRALELNFSSVKINAVLMKENFSAELAAFQEFVRTRPVAVRFIELMPTHDNQAFFEAQHLRSEHLRSLLIAQGWEARERATDDGPAFEFTHPLFAGRIGIIAPYAPSFCDNCNRLRVTSRGGLRLCLFGDEDYPIREFLQSASDGEKFEDHLRSVLMTKKVSHFLGSGKIGNNRSFSVMGG